MALPSFEKGREDEMKKKAETTHRNFGRTQASDCAARQVLAKSPNKTKLRVETHE